MEVISSINKLYVYFHERLVGTLGRNIENTLCTFQYDKAWLNDGFSISPLELPLKPDLFIANATPFYGNFGVFEDSLPDGYGRYLLHRILQKKGVDEFALTPLQRLAIVGNAGMGALRYRPEILPAEEKTLPMLEAVQQLALDVLSERTTEGADILYFNSGNSGGCRPKCLMHDAEGHWLVKFRHTYDPQDLGIQEYHYNELARRCGIDVPDYRLLEGKYFATRRFDIDEQGSPVHVVTAAALLRESISPPTTDYKILLALTGYMTQDPKAVEEMFRRMVFNVLIENKDDHAKNFSFICRDGKWTLAPHYDITRCAQGYNGEHATSVMGNGNPSRTDLIRAAQSIRIPKNRAEEIISELEHLAGECRL